MLRPLGGSPCLTRVPLEGMNGMPNTGKGIPRERRGSNRLTDDEVDEIAYRAADLVIEAVYIEVGKVTARAVLLVLGTSGTALCTWLYHLSQIGAK